MFKHVDANHTLIAKRFEEKVNGLLKEREKKNNHQRKEQICLVGQISTTFVVKDSYKKEDMPQKEFLKDRGLMLRAICIIQFVEFFWLKRLTLYLFQN